MKHTTAENWLVCPYEKQGFYLNKKAVMKLKRDFFSERTVLPMVLYGCKARAATRKAENRLDVEEKNGKDNGYK